MTQQDNGNAYFFYMCEENETTMPSEIVIKSHVPAKGSKVSLLGSNKSLKWVTHNKGFKVLIPKSLQNNPPSDYVWTIKVSALKKEVIYD